jgi:hypothetical protein
LASIIRRPTNESNLAPAPLAALQLILDIKDGVAATDSLLSAAVFALGVEQLLAEDVEVCFFRRLLDDNLLPVVADLVDYPFDVLAELELVECADAFGGDGDTVVVLVNRQEEVRGRCEGGGCAM